VDDVLREQLMAALRPREAEKKAPPAVKTSEHWMGASHQLQMCVFDEHGVFQDTVQLIIKAQLGEGGNSRVFRVAKVPKATGSSSSSSSGTGVDGRGAGNAQQQQQHQDILAPEPSDMALKAAQYSDPSLRTEYWYKTLKEYDAARTATGVGARYVLVPEAVGYLQCANGEEWPCLLMELAPHGCLQDVICPGSVPRGLPPAAAAHVIARMRSALHSIHLGGVIHRDLKPHNVLLFGTKEKPIPKLADFGEAGFISNFMSARTAGLGTHGYQTREMLMGEAQDSSTDVYQLALMYLHLRWGVMPFSYLEVCKDDTLEVMAEKIKRAQDPLKELERDDCLYNQDQCSSGGPPKLNEVEREFLNKCLSTSTQGRYKSGDLLDDDLIEEGLCAEVGYW
jgi:serine/threonine protein kinase